TGHWSRWAMVAAAAILVLLAAVTIRLLNAQSPVDAVPNVPTIADDNKEPAPQVHTPETPKAPENLKSLIVADKQDRGISNTGKPQGGRQVARNDRPRKVQATTIAANQLAQNEVVTDYIPLTYMNNSTAFDSGLVVR